MATKTENSNTVIPLELQRTALKFQRQVRDFRPRRAPMKCRQVFATMTDNPKWQCGSKNWKYLYLWNYTVVQWQKESSDKIADFDLRPFQYM